MFDIDKAGRPNLSDIEPIILRPRGAGAGTSGSSGASVKQARFDRRELTTILDLYGRKVAAGEWRDYALDMLRDKAVFSVYRRASEYPLYRIEKEPRLARRQGAYSVVAAGGLILRRGHDLARVLSVLEKRFDIVGG